MPGWQDMEVAGEDAAIVLDDQILIAGSGECAAVSLACRQLVHDAVEEADGDTLLVVSIPFVADGDEEIAPLACGDG